MKYSELVRNLIKPGADIAADMNAVPWRLPTLLEACDRAVYYGGRLDRIKKAVVYGNDDGTFVRHFNAATPTVTPAQANLLHMAVGIAGEAAELLEVILDHIDGKPLDTNKAVKELGDIGFYIEGMRQALRVSRVMVEDVNYTKLTYRYPDGKYTNEAAIKRADVTEKDDE